MTFTLLRTVHPLAEVKATTASRSAHLCNRDTAVLREGNTSPRNKPRCGPQPTARPVPRDPCGVLASLADDEGRGSFYVYDILHAQGRFYAHEAEIIKGYSPHAPPIRYADYKEKDTARLRKDIRVSLPSGQEVPGRIVVHLWARCRALLETLVPEPCPTASLRARLGNGSASLSTARPENFVRLTPLSLNPASTEIFS